MVAIQRRIVDVAAYLLMGVLTISGIYHLAIDRIDIGIRELLYAGALLAIFWAVDWLKNGAS